MPVPRLLPVFLSVLFAIGLWVYGAVRLQTTEGTRGGYATLVCGESFPDREIRDRLDSQGLTGLVSESDQWFLLDCFGNIEKIPLVEYEERLLPFDPRNDGYAEKLKSLFVRDGKRFVFIPLGINRPEDLETKIAQALTGISYSLEYARASSGRDILLPLMAICLTACAFFVIPALRRRLNAGLLPCLLTLSPLAFGLAPGFALLSLLAGFAALLAEPDRKLSCFPRRQKALSFDLPKPFTAKWLLAVALIACYGLFSFFSGLPVLFTFFVLAAFCCLLLVSISSSGGKLSTPFTVNKWHPRRRRFTPVEIISRKTVSAGFFLVMLPFAVMAMALVFADLVRPQPPSSPVMNVSPPPFMAPPLMAPPEGAITEADFQEHYLFQTAFSLRSLGKTYEAGGFPPAIAGYELSSNGLLEPQPSPQGEGSPLEPVAPGIDEEIQIPDFPLSDFLRGLNSAPPRAADTGNHGNSAPLDWLFALLPFIFILPAFIYRRKKGTGGWGRGTGGRRRPLADHAHESGLQRRRDEKKWGLGK
jgi:hypothetical protein